VLEQEFRLSKLGDGNLFWIPPLAFIELILKRQDFGIPSTENCRPANPGAGLAGQV
jgi:hypothetical protein